MGSENDQPRIRCGRFRSYRSLHDVEVPLQSRFVLLVGGNASGKSSVLDAFHLVSQGTKSVPDQRKLARLFRGRHTVGRVRTSGATDDLDLGIATAEHSVWLRCSIAEGECEYRLGLGDATRLEEPSTLRRKLAEEKDASSGLNKLLARDELTGLASSLRLRLSPERAVQPVPPRGNEARIDHDGYGLPAALAWLASNDPERRAAIEHALSQVVPGASRVRTPNEEIHRDEQVLTSSPDSETLIEGTARRRLWAHTLEVYMDGVGWLPGDLLSEGTVLALTMLTILHSSSSPKLLLLDDLDRALHPTAQFEIVDRIRDVLVEDPDLQIVATAHAPYLLDRFEADDVCVLARDERGHTQLKLLSQHPDHERFQGTLRPGEFWASVGEDWVLERDQAAE
jgi:predicted ATPase